MLYTASHPITFAERDYMSPPFILFTNSDSRVSFLLENNTMNEWKAYCILHYRKRAIIKCRNECERLLQLDSIKRTLTQRKRADAVHLVSDDLAL